MDATMNADGTVTIGEFDWNAGVLEALALEDTSPNKITLRVAKRIAATGMTLLDVKRENGHQEGFNWGRSSNGVTRQVIWTIRFETAGDVPVEHVVNVVVATTTYTKRNPYDRTPKDNGQPSYVLLALDDTKKVLGWDIKQASSRKWLNAEAVKN
jgi:hypothetical protein